MKNLYDAIYNILSKIEEMQGSGLAFAYYDEAGFLSICTTNYEMYMKDARFSKFTRVWRKMLLKFKQDKVVFCCKSAKENQLFELANADNLFLAP